MFVENKTVKGQFYTVRSPFKHELFFAWLDLIPNLSDKVVVEPFAGANNIPLLLKEATSKISWEQWRAYDIEPEAVASNRVPQISLIENDSLAHMPKGDLAITNPPYLAKNSAKRMGLSEGIDFGKFGDLWEISVDKMLDSYSYVAAIIPESFLTRGLFLDRLFGVVSITEHLFDDTEFPVCLALWVPDKRSVNKVYVGSELVGDLSSVKARSVDLLVPSVFSGGIKIVHNDPEGVLGLKAVDSPKGASIAFVRGDTIPSSEIKVSSRAITRISFVNKETGENLSISEDRLDGLIAELNEKLAELREQTKDILMTSFKGLRADGVYRRRLDWKASSAVLRAVLSEKFVS